MSEQKKFSHGMFQVNFTGRVVSDPIINSNQAKNGGEPFESVFINAVCSPYRGGEDPESIFVGVNFSGPSTALAKKLVKGDTISFTGYMIREPKTYKNKNQEVKVSMEIRASRDAGTLQVFKRNGNGNGAGGASSGQNTAASGGSSNPFDDSDIPF